MIKVFWQSTNKNSTFLVGDLTLENKRLNEKNQELLREIIDLQDVKIENQALREVIGAGQEKEFSLALTEIIGVDDYQDFILVDKGWENGISENMPVVNSQKVLFGKILKVYKNFSKIMLISSKNSVVNVKIQKDDTVSFPIYGVAKGEGSFTAALDVIPQDFEIKKDDVLITSSLEGTFPKNLLVGKITNVRKNDLKPFQTAKVELFFNLKQTNKLFVITNYKTE